MYTKSADMVLLSHFKKGCFAHEIAKMKIHVQSNFSGSNTLGTIKISSRQGKFEPKRVDNNARSVGIIRISLIFYNMKVYCVFSLESPQ